MEAHPAWYLNKKANPHVKVRLGGERFDALAEEIPEEEREALSALDFLCGLLFDVVVDVGGNCRDSQHRHAGVVGVSHCGVRSLIASNGAMKQPGEPATG